MLSRRHTLHLFRSTPFSFYSLGVKSLRIEPKDFFNNNANNKQQTTSTLPLHRAVMSSSSSRANVENLFITFPSNTTDPSSPSEIDWSFLQQGNFPNIHNLTIQGLRNNNTNHNQFYDVARIQEVTAGRISKLVFQSAVEKNKSTKGCLVLHDNTELNDQILKDFLISNRSSLKHLDLHLNQTKLSPPKDLVALIGSTVGDSLEYLLLQQGGRHQQKGEEVEPSSFKTQLKFYTELSKMNPITAEDEEELTALVFPSFKTLRHFSYLLPQPFLRTFVPFSKMPCLQTLTYHGTGIQTFSSRSPLLPSSLVGLEMVVGVKGDADDDNEKDKSLEALAKSIEKDTPNLQSLKLRGGIVIPKRDAVANERKKMGRVDVDVLKSLFFEDADEQEKVVARGFCTKLTELWIQNFTESSFSSSSSSTFSKLLSGFLIGSPKMKGQLLSFRYDTNTSNNNRNDEESHQSSSPILFESLLNNQSKLTYLRFNAENYPVKINDQVLKRIAESCPDLTFLLLLCGRKFINKQQRSSPSPSPLLSSSVVTHQGLDDFRDKFPELQTLSLTNIRLDDEVYEAIRLADVRAKSPGQRCKSLRERSARQTKEGEIVKKKTPEPFAHFKKTIINDEKSSGQAVAARGGGGDRAPVGINIIEEKTKEKKGSRFVSRKRSQPSSSSLPSSATNKHHHHDEIPPRKVQDQEPRKIVEAEQDVANNNDKKFKTEIASSSSSKNQKKNVQNNKKSRKEKSSCNAAREEKVVENNDKKSVATELEEQLKDI